MLNSRPMKTGRPVDIFISVFVVQLSLHAFLFFVFFFYNAHPPQLPLKHTHGNAVGSLTDDTIWARNSIKPTTKQIKLWEWIAINHPQWYLSLKKLIEHWFCPLTDMDIHWGINRSGDVKCVTEPINLIYLVRDVSVRSICRHRLWNYRSNRWIRLIWD